MKTAFALLVLGLICGAASEKCTKDECTGDEYNACVIKRKKTHPETEDALQEVCKQRYQEYDCRKDFFKRCYDDEYDDFFYTSPKIREMDEMEIRFFDRVCGENDLKQDYLERTPCINENIEPLRAQCREKIINEDPQRRYRHWWVMICEGEELSNMCGGDNPEVIKLWYEYKLFCTISPR